MTKPKKLKRVVIKEELVALTGKVEHAIILNQFIYWSERVRDVDKYLNEEMDRIRKFSDGSMEKEEDIKETLTNGWIYKSATEMKDECMFEKSETTLERIMKSLVENGWLDRRTNPKYKWDKKYQYRVNILKIQKDLMKLGYALEGYSLPIPEDKNTGEDSNLQNEVSTVQNEASRLQNEGSTLQNEGAIPEITIKTTLETINSVCEEEKEIISLLEKREDINPHTHKQLVSLFNALKKIDSFQYSIFKDTLNLVNFAISDLNYFKRALTNNLQKGYVRPAIDNAGIGVSTQKEKLPDWYEKSEEREKADSEFKAAWKKKREEENKKELTPEEIAKQQQEIDAMLQQLRA